MKNRGVFPQNPLVHNENSAFSAERFPVFGFHNGNRWAFAGKSMYEWSFKVLSIDRIAIDILKNYFKILKIS